MAEESSKLPIHYEKSRLFRVIHVDGAYGGLMPTTKEGRVFITMSLYSERAPLPRGEALPVDHSGKSVGKPEVTDTKSGIFREFESCSIMDLATAKQIHGWLTDKIREGEEYERAFPRSQNAAGSDDASDTHSA